MLNSWTPRRSAFENGAIQVSISLRRSGMSAPAFVLVRVRHAVAHEPHDRVRPERFGERCSTARAQDAGQLARSVTGSR